MYVNIKILAAFPWFQALNILVTPTLSRRCQKRTAAPQENRVFSIEKASKIPNPVSPPILPAKP